MLPCRANVFFLTCIRHAIEVRSSVAVQAPESGWTMTNKSSGAHFTCSSIPTWIWVTGGFLPLTRWSCKTGSTKITSLLFKPWTMCLTLFNSQATHDLCPAHVYILYLLLNIKRLSCNVMPLCLISLHGSMENMVTDMYTPGCNIF